MLISLQVVEALFALNEDSQSLMAIFDKIKNGHVNLIEGQRLARAVKGGAETTETFQSVSSVPTHGQGNHQGSRPSSRASPVSQTKGEGIDLLDMDFSHFPAPPVRHSPAHAHQQQQQQFHQPPHYPVHAGSPSHAHGYGHAAPPGRHSPHVVDPFAVPQAVPRQAHYPPQQQHYQQQQQPHVPVHPVASSSEAPRHTHSPHAMHPPPQVHVQAHYVEKPIAIIELPKNDPFTTDSLDALFTGTPVVPVKEEPEVKILAQPKDPFSPDALDALFDSKPATAAKKQADPFSEEALDALFAAPAPQAPARVHGKTSIAIFPLWWW